MTQADPQLASEIQENFKNYASRMRALVTLQKKIANAMINKLEKAKINKIKHHIHKNKI